MARRAGIQPASQPASNRQATACCTSRSVHTRIHVFQLHFVGSKTIQHTFRQLYAYDTLKYEHCQREVLAALATHISCICTTCRTRAALPSSAPHQLCPPIFPPLPKNLSFIIVINSFFLSFFLSYLFTESAKPQFIATFRQMAPQSNNKHNKHPLSSCPKNLSTFIWIKFLADSSKYAAKFLLFGLFVQAGNLGVSSYKALQMMISFIYLSRTADGLVNQA